MDGWSTAKMAAQVVIVVVFVLTVIQLVLAQHDGDLRLVQGTTSRNGRLEIYRSAEWVTIYDGGGFGLREAVVACRQLGYTNVDADDVDVYRGGAFGSGTSTMRLDGVRCEGGEAELLECSFTICTEDGCSDDSDIGISCGSSEGHHYIPRGTGYRGWSGFVFLLITIPFCGHAYRRRGSYSASRSFIPIPRFHHGGVPLTTALDEPGMTSSPGTGPSQYEPYSNSPQDIPAEPMAQVYTQGYVYPPSITPSSARPTLAVQPTPANEAANGSLVSPHYTRDQSPGYAPEGSIGTGHHVPLTFPNVPPPEYSEQDNGAMSPVVPSEFSNDSIRILDPPPAYEDIVKS